MTPELQAAAERITRVKAGAAKTQVYPCPDRGGGTGGVDDEPMSIQEHIKRQRRLLERLARLRILGMERGMYSLVRWFEWPRPANGKRGSDAT